LFHICKVLLVFERLVACYEYLESGILRGPKQCAAFETGKSGVDGK
jgi:hypothetical protein